MLKRTVYNANNQIKVPPLMSMYLRYGAKIIGTPAIDREFKTIDYFVLMDIANIDEHTFKLILGR
jgi:putative hemolysin